VATIVWLVMYLAGPGRRHAFYLAAALLGIWGVLLLQIAIDEGDVGSRSLGVEVQEQDPFETGPADVSTDDVPTRVAVVSLGLGLVYLLLGYRGDRAGDTRRATALIAVSLAPITVGVIAFADLLDAETTSALGMVTSLLLIAVGAATLRRFTAWYGALTLVISTLALVFSIVDDDLGVAGITLLVLGFGLAFVADLVGGDERMPADQEPTTF
jgi:hypothetical protein